MKYDFGFTSPSRLSVSAEPSKAIPVRSRSSFSDRLRRDVREPLHQPLQELGSGAGGRRAHTGNLAAAAALPLCDDGVARITSESGLFGFGKSLQRRQAPSVGSSRLVLRRTLIIGGLLALVWALPAAAQVQTLMPGVTYERAVQFTSHGPVALHVVSGPRPTGLYALRPVLSNETISGTERVTAMQKRLSAGATMVGINGDFFNLGDRPAERRAPARRDRRQPALRRPLERRPRGRRDPRRPPDRVLRHLEGARPAAGDQRPQPASRPERRLALHVELRAGDPRPGGRGRRRDRAVPGRRRRTPTSPARSSSSPAAPSRSPSAARCSSRAEPPRRG